VFEKIQIQEKKIEHIDFSGNILIRRLINGVVVNINEE
jgi:hypothetical protein